MLFGLAVNEGKLTSQRTRLKNQNGCHLCRLGRKVYTFVSPSHVRESVSKSLFNIYAVDYCSTNLRIKSGLLILLVLFILLLTQ